MRPVNVFELVLNFTFIADTSVYVQLTTLQHRQVTTLIQGFSSFGLGLTSEYDEDPFHHAHA